jgi:hypothetical protein
MGRTLSREYELTIVVADRLQVRRIGLAEQDSNACNGSFGATNRSRHPGRAGRILGLRGRGSNEHEDVHASAHV